MTKIMDEQDLDKDYVKLTCERAREEILELDPDKPGLNKGANLASLEMRLNVLYGYAADFPDSEYLIHELKELHDFAKEKLPKGIYESIYKR
jgi:hypothetical protein